jgi:hypothetical protein
MAHPQRRIQLTLHCDNRRELARDRIQGPYHIKNYKMGRLPRLQVLARLAGVLEVTIDWVLVGGKK